MPLQWLAAFTVCRYKPRAPRAACEAESFLYKIPPSLAWPCGVWSNSANRQPSRVFNDKSTVSRVQLRKIEQHGQTLILSRCTQILHVPVSESLVGHEIQPVVTHNSAQWPNAKGVHIDPKGLGQCPSQTATEQKSQCTHIQTLYHHHGY